MKRFLEGLGVMKFVTISNHLISSDRLLTSEFKYFDHFMTSKVASLSKTCVTFDKFSCFR